MNEPLNSPAAHNLPPSNYLIGAILATVFCCQIFGIVSIIYAAQVNSRWQAGDREGAVSASKNAQLWMWVAIGSAVVIVIAAVSFGLLAALLGDACNW